jgi:TolB-like protein/DNA-binding winged helix-turn-helix (wHTH) protein/Tfp pilus assembly protein PilF
MDDSKSKTYRFGPFEVDVEQRLLSQAGDPVPLTPKAFDTLLVLVERPGKVLEKAELLKLVWPNTFVEENNLTQNISALRKVFGDADYIETIPRRGYRFRVKVEDVSPSEAGAVNFQPDAVPHPGRRRRSGWLWTGLALTAAVGAFYAVEGIRSAGRPTYRVDSLVILPFVNLTGNPDDEYFCDGLTEELTNYVAQLDGLRVVARTTAFQFKGKARDIRSIAQQLKVSSVVEGSVRRQGDTLRVTVQLNDAESGYHVWSQAYDRGAGDIFGIQEDISRQVVHNIRPDGGARPTVGVRDREAYRLYLLGRFQRGRPDSVRKAIALFEQAIEKDAGYAAAYAGLAECYVKLAQQKSMPPVEALAVARKFVDKALALDDNLAEAHTTQAIVQLMDLNWQGAERQFRRAIALNANDATAHHWFSHYFLAMGRPVESLASSRRALDLDPLDLQISGHLIFHYVRAREFPSAIKAGLQTLELDPNSQLAYLFLTWAYEDIGEWDKAIYASQRSGASKLDSETSTLQAAVRAGGARGYWKANQAFLEKQKNPENYRVAVTLARLGEADKALAHLEAAFHEREPELLYVKSEPAFDWMQGNPRFAALTKAMKLP